jgi:type VI secretion system secreted protein Hcp
MSIPVNPMRAVKPEGIDTYLYLKTKRAGIVKGESQTPDHVDEIEVRSWRWGVASSSAIGHTVATSRRSYTALTVVKSIDIASTPLMAALATNDEVTEARLSVRRSGGDQEVYYSIVLKNARVAGVDQEVDNEGFPSETITLMFQKIEVEYRPQKTTGLRGGSYTFNDELTSNG